MTDLAALGVRTEARQTSSAAAAEDETGIRRDGDWLVTAQQWAQWRRNLEAAVDASTVAHPLDPGLSLEAALRAGGLPDVRLVAGVARDARLEVKLGRVTKSDAAPSFGPAEAGLQALESRLRERSFDAPERPDLQRWGLGARELAATEHAGRVLRLPDDVVLLPATPALAMRILVTLPQPFTTSAARQALKTTRRVAIPLLEHLDARGWTR